QHAAQTVLADADLTEAGMAHHGLLAGTVMDQTAQGVVDLDQLIDAGTPAVTAAIAFRATHRAVQGRCLCRVHFQQLAFPDGAVCGRRQPGRRVRTRRWASTPLSVEDSRKCSTPMSRRRVMAPMAVLVCRVENTRWPVRLA